MADGSWKRRQSKRSNFKTSAAMASRPSSRPFRTPRSTALLVSICLICFIVLVSGISLNALRRSAKYGVQSPIIYSIEVVNEFPHDPRAFTQVSQFSSHFQSLHYFCSWLNLVEIHQYCSSPHTDANAWRPFPKCYLVIFRLSIFLQITSWFVYLFLIVMRCCRVLVCF